MAIYMMREEPTYTFSYDFTTWSIADLQSKWWSTGSWNSISSSGYMNTSRNWSVLSLTSSDLWTATQSCTTATLVLTWSASGQHQRLVNLNKNWTQSLSLYWDGVSTTYWNQATFGGEYLILEDGYWNNWTYTTTFTVDLSNKTWEYVSTSHSTLTWTVTDAEITAFRGSNTINVYWESSAYIKSFSVIID